MSDELGHIVREAWVAYCIETGRTERPDHIAPWEQMDEWSKEVDRRIGTAVAEHVGAKLRAELAAARAELQTARNEIKAWREQLAFVGKQRDEWNICADKEQSQVAELESELADARAALERVNWVNDYCLWCKRFYDDGHAPDCARQVALGKKPEDAK